MPDIRLENFDDWILKPLKRCWFLTGPTGSGKTPLALEIAQRLNAEILSLDSMAIYRGMDIGTAKPSRSQQDQIRHHMLDIIEPVESFSVSNFVVEAHRIAEQIHAREANVLICGGTPLYLKSLLRGLFLGPSADWEFREAVERDLADHGEAALLSRLEQIDPLLAAKLHPHDHRRIIRAMEVAKITGRPLSHWQQQFDSPAAVADAPAVVLQLERSWLHERINTRVDQMVDSGLMHEVQGLLAKHGELGRTAAQAVGYKELILHLNGELDLAAATEQIKAHTRQFARRQEIWFRGLTELQPVRLEPEKDLSDVADEIIQVFQQCDQTSQ